MARYSILISLIFALLLVNCAKEAHDLSIPIRGISKYWEHDFDQRRLIELRLSFAKTVARAFVDLEFTQYFKNKYCTTTDGHFEELFFGLSRDEIVKPSGTTLYQHLKAAVDPEVFDLFGDSFLDQVLQYDPCVVIKLPDVFASFDWQENKIRPVVIAQLPYVDNPSQLLGTNNYFVGYHLTGLQVLMHDRLSYFHVIVKYSEDYAMLDRQFLINEKGISFYEFLPQALKVSNGMREEILNSGTPHKFHGGHVVVRKLEIFELYRQLYGFNGKYWSKAPCSDLNCVRKCIPIDESVVICDSVTMFDTELFSLFNGPYFDESFTYSWSFWGVGPDVFFERVCIPSLPHSWFDTRAFDIKAKSSSMLFLPKIEVSVTGKKSYKTYPVKVVAIRGLPADAYFQVAGHVIIYGLDELLFGLAPEPYTKESIVRASMIFFDGNAPLSACANIIRFQSGQQHCKLDF